MALIEITCGDECEPPPWIDSYRILCYQTLTRMALFCVEVSILFCADRQMRVINRRYRNSDNATDVLSFPQYAEGYDYQRGSSHLDQLGDVVISLPSAARNAVRAGVSIFEESVRLTIHGLLHCLGYTHAATGEHRSDSMLIIQEHIVKSLLSSQAELSQ